MKIAISQSNLLVGDIDGNAEHVIATARRAREELSADAVLFPELTLTGYPPEDLLLRPDLYRRQALALERICAATRNIDVLVGYAHRADEGVYNACAYVREGRIIARYFKQHLPNYGVFDEKRYFVPGHAPCLIDLEGIRVALTICEDVWVPEPTRQAREHAADVIFNINASPYHVGKGAEREKLLALRTKEAGVPIVYVNLVGGQDELVFDGASLVMNPTAEVMVRGAEFDEGLYVAELGGENAPTALSGEQVPALSREESMYKALVTGVRDYVNKNQFPGVVIGVSGGIDSALTLAIAADAIGGERIEALSMPSRYTARMSVDDARAQASAMGARFHLIPIESVFEAFLESLRDVLAGTTPDTTEENIQARCRGVILMAVSNKLGKIVLATGNKSEMAVGYATLYGDMAGGFAPLKDVPKTEVYRLARWRNAVSSVIPPRVLDRPPSAELAEGQLDTDSLPDYPTLDAILERFVERDYSVEEVIDDGFEEKTVRSVIFKVIRNEYKRRQAAPGVRITRRAFGRDRRYPITSGYPSRSREPVTSNEKS